MESAQFDGDKAMHKNTRFAIAATMLALTAIFWSASGTIGMTHHSTAPYSSPSAPQLEPVL
jgi:hypothetical protein